MIRHGAADVQKKKNQKAFHDIAAGNYSSAKKNQKDESK